MNLAILLKSGVMHIDDISMTRDTSMGFQISGILPLRNTKEIRETSHYILLLRI